MDARVMRILADGEFGAEVASQLAEQLTTAGWTAQVAYEPLGEQLPAFVAGADVCIRASWRDIRAEFDEFADAAMAAGCAFVPIAYTDPYIRVGPAVAPGQAPCHHCYRTRTRQHARPEETVRDEVERALRQDPRLGVTGYPPHAAALATGLALGLLGRATAVPALVRAGQVDRIDCRTDTIRTWLVRPVHGCPVCGAIPGQSAAGKIQRNRLRALALSAAGATPGEKR